MTNITIDRELLERVLKYREGDAGDSGRDELTAILAKPAPEVEAAGIPFQIYECLSAWKPKSRREMDAKNSAVRLVMGDAK